MEMSGHATKLCMERYQNRTFNQGHEAENWFSDLFDYDAPQRQHGKDLWSAESSAIPLIASLSVSWAHGHS